MGVFLRKYGTGTGADIIIPMIKRGVVDFAASGDWTPASGDVKISLDGGAGSNIGTLPVINGTYGWKFVFSDAELQAKSIRVTIVDSATKVVEDQMFLIETYGHASAMYKPDFSDSVRLGLTALPNAAADAAGGLPISDAGGLDLDTQLGKLVGTLATGTHNPQSGDAYSYLTTNLGLLGASLSAIPKTGFKLASDGLAAISAWTVAITGNITGNLSGSVGSVATDGISAAAVSAAAASKIAAATEAAILDEGDATALLAAIAAKVEEFLINEGDATATIAAIATACNAAVAAGTVGTNVGAIKTKTDNLPAAPASTGDVTSARDSVLTRLGTPADTDLATDIAAVKTDTGNLVTRITSTLFSGITSLLGMIRLMLRNDSAVATDHATELGEINANSGTGTGSYDPTTDAQEAPVNVALGPDDIQDIVDGVSQGLSFPTAEDIAAELGGNNVVATFPLLIEGDETVIIQNEDYFDADGNAAQVTINATGIETAVADDWDFVFWGQGDSAGQVVTGSPSSGAANTITVKFDLPAAKTSLVTAGLGGWRVRHKPNATTRQFSEVEGLLRVKPTK